MTKHFLNDIINSLPPLTERDQSRYRKPRQGRHEDPAQETEDVHQTAEPTAGVWKC